jgi:hypothetical protein
MPKLYEYFGLVVYFYANEHEPVHVHGNYQGCEARAELVLRDGKVIAIRFTNVAGKRPLRGPKLKDFKRLVKIKANDIVDRWVDFFVKKKHIEAQVISRKLS